MTADPETTEPFRRDDESAIDIFLQFHGRARTFLDVMDELAASASSGGGVDKRKAAALAEFVSGPLLWHDTDEETYLLPLLRQKAQDPMLEKILKACAKTHAQLEERLEGLVPVLEKLAAGEPADIEVLSLAARTARQLLEPHMRLEESTVFPYAIDVIETEELVRMGAEIRERAHQRLRGETRVRRLRTDEGKKVPTGA